jgi:hypothetical protein
VQTLLFALRRLDTERHLCAHISEHRERDRALHTERLQLGQQPHHLGPSEQAEDLVRSAEISQ